MITYFDLIMIVVGGLGLFALVSCLQEIGKNPIAYAGIGLGCGCLLAFSFWAVGGLHVQL